MIKHLMILVGLTISTGAQAATPITGRWITAGGTSIVSIAPCGDKICGTIEQIFGTDTPETLTDTKNAEMVLKTRRLLGLVIVNDLGADTERWTGSIYNPENGKTYTTHIEHKANHLEVQGCILIVCQTQYWWRVK